MAVNFTDKNGIVGTISDSLEVDYNGEWKEEVVEFVTRVNEGGFDEDGRIKRLDVDSHLMIELPEVAPIIETKRGIDPSKYSEI